MKLYVYLLAALTVINFAEIANADSCYNFTGSAALGGGMIGVFEQKDCDHIKVSWGRADLSAVAGQTFSLNSDQFKKDPSEGFGSNVISYRYKLIGHSLVMQYKDDGSPEIDGYVFTMGRNGRLNTRAL